MMFHKLLLAAVAALLMTGCTDSSQDFLREEAVIRLRSEGPSFEGVKFFACKVALNNPQTTAAVYTGNNYVVLCELPELKIRYKMKTSHAFSWLEFIGESDSIIGAAVSAQGDQVSVLDGQSGEVTRSLQYPARSVYAVVRSKSSAVILVFREEREKLSVIDANSGKTLFSFSQIEMFQGKADLCKKTNELAIGVGMLGERGQGIAVLDVKEGKLKSFIPLAKFPLQLKFSPSGKFLGVAHDDLVQVWEKDIEERKWQQRWQAQGGPPLSFSENEGCLAYVWPEHTKFAVKTLDLSSGESSEPMKAPMQEGEVTFALGENPFRIAIANTGRRIVVVHLPKTGQTYRADVDSVLSPLFIVEASLHVMGGDGVLRRFTLPK